MARGPRAFVPNDHPDIHNSFANRYGRYIAKHGAPYDWGQWCYPGALVLFFVGGFFDPVSFKIFAGLLVAGLISGLIPLRS